MPCVSSLGDGTYGQVPAVPPFRHRRTCHRLSSVPLQTSSESRREENEHGRLPIANLAALYQLQRVRESQRFERHEFVSFAAALAPGEPGCHESMNPLVDEAGCCVDRVRRLDVRGGTAGLFHESPPSTIHRQLVGVESARRYFVEEILGGVAVLLDQQDLRIGA